MVLQDIGVAVYIVTTVVNHAGGGALTRTNGDTHITIYDEAATS